MRRVQIVLLSMICIFALNLTSSHIQASESQSTVNYNYDNQITTVNPDYIVSIPIGVVFKADNPGVNVGVDIEMLSSNNQTIPVGSKADISVSSKNGYFVSLDIDGKNDPVEYQLKYNEIVLEGKNISQKVGTLQKTSNPKNDILVLKGEGYIIGAATKTGIHTDILIYTVDDNSQY